MSYQTVEPVAKKRMLRKRYRGHNTICQVLRDIYGLSEDEGVRLKCRLAMAMAKKMQDRLKYYKKLHQTLKESGHEY
jgi:Mn-dependent DtxR family transcriptional regulator